MDGKGGGSSAGGAGEAPATDLARAWEGFARCMKMFTIAKESINGPCAAADLAELDRRLGGAPPSLRELLGLANGQKADSPGLFKSVSGWNRYRRHVFLDAAGVAAVHAEIRDDEMLGPAFGDRLVPLSENREGTLLSETYAVNRDDGTVWLLWTLPHDIWLPPDWQLNRFPRGMSLADFLDRQTASF